MDHKTVEEYILSMPNSKLDYPFGEDVAVYKVLIKEEKPDNHQGESQEQPLASQVSREQGDAEQHNESYDGYGDGAAQATTPLSATSADSISGSARKQDSAMRGEWKMFALVAEGKEPVRLSLKCDPQLSRVLRERYESVQEGYHLNKKHWITIILTGQLEWPEVQDLIRHSYQLVTKS